jgi:hypothetical protein
MMVKLRVLKNLRGLLKMNDSLGVLSGVSPFYFIDLFFFFFFLHVHAGKGGGGNSN